MQPQRWLRRSVPGFNDLSAEERAAIRDFSLLWSLFEGTVLHTRANADRIVEAVSQLRDAGRLQLEPFDAPIGHFRARYFDGQNFTPAFDQHLHFRNGDNRPLAKAFVSGQTNDEAEIIAGLLIIVYRLRNNLFHGIKWAYGIRDQLDNFRHANESLMAVMDLYEGRHPQQRA